MKKEITINMEDIKFTGNVLDIGCENYGIVYNVFKESIKNKNNINVEYINGKEEKELIKKGIYDVCVMLFSLNNIWLTKSKKDFIEDISSYLKEGGILHIWDIDKGYNKTFNGDIRILLPNRRLKKISIKDFNVFKDNSKDKVEYLLKDSFHIKEKKSLKGIYYIKAVKREKL
ncbi:hypothetical protein CLOACE_15970 [Clostridium acetireducens DSM 10703]|uniref:Class I SAM-dependent methyltransferase n=1 Tax=Clostridium acetireducens DSM 10703 TaxID=1121290 RepID=A0A1E8EXS8_9CLOT|nr:hypothetical protein CLOACE_15970 [Clostridium acetireducens DSM 10703]